MLKKTILLAMAAAIVAAFAMPAAASASLWKHHAQAIPNDRQITLTGQAKFQGAVGSVECQTTSQITLTAGTSTGNVTKFEPDLDEAGSTVTQKCKAGGFLAGCQIHSSVGENLPWVVHNTTQKIDVTSGSIRVGFTGGFCPGQSATVTPPDGVNHFVTANPNQPHTVTSFELHGQVLVHVYNGAHDAAHTVQTGTATVTGTATILAPNAHTYSLT
jgi:hypothetical protein